MMSVRNVCYKCYCVEICFTVISPMCCSLHSLYSRSIVKLPLVKFIFLSFFYSSNIITCYLVVNNVKYIWLSTEPLAHL